MRLKEVFLTFPMYIVSSPFKGFDELKYNKRGSYIFSLVMLIALSLFAIADVLGHGFVTQYARVQYVNGFFEVFLTLAPILLFVVANWSITAITDGKGRIGEIFMVYMYASFPKLILSIIGLIVSNVIAIEEIAMFQFFYTFGTVAFAFYLFIGLIIVHEYTFTKAIAMILLTFVSMGIIVFVLSLFLSLVQEVIVFFSTVYQEIVLKL